MSKTYRVLSSADYGPPDNARLDCETKDWEKELIDCTGAVYANWRYAVRFKEDPDYVVYCSAHARAARSMPNFDKLAVLANSEGRRKRPLTWLPKEGS